MSHTASTYQYQGSFHSLDIPNSPDQTFTWKPANPFIQVTNGSLHKVYLDDILAIRETEDASESFEIIYYPIEGGKRVRRRSLIVCENLHKLRMDLELRLKPPHPPHNPQKLVSRRTLVLVNPFSGQKKALNLYNTFSKPIFLEANIVTELRYTKHVNHATEIVRTLDIDAYESIAIVSGDGLVNEVITGLITRSDRDRALRIPILHIPGGTGNALAASIAFKCGEPFSPRGGFCRELTLMAPNPVHKRLRLHHFESAVDGHRVVFLSAIWGLVADIDIGSERFRWAGMIRLHMEAIIRIMQLPSAAKYRGKISYLPVDDDELIRKTRLKYNEARNKFGKNHFAGGNVPELPELDVSQRNERTATIQEAFKGREVVRMPRLDEPVPEDWVVLDSEFCYAQVSSLSHLGSDLPYIPTSTLEEEVLYLTMIEWKTVKSRFQVAKLFTFMDICDHLDYSCFHIIPVRACRIEPAPGGGCYGPGHVAVDGEPCTKGSTFQVCASDLCATVVTRQLRD